MQMNKIVGMFVSILMLLSGCTSSLHNMIDELNTEIDKKATSQKVNMFNTRNASSISFDDLHVYVGMEKRDVMSRLYTGLNMVRVREYAANKNLAAASGTKMVEEFDVLRLKENEQIELGRIVFIDNKLFKAIKNLKTYEERESLKGINYFIDIALKTQEDFNIDSRLSIKRRKDDNLNGMSIQFYQNDKSFSKEITLNIVKTESGNYIYVREILIDGIALN